jgi:hypothetical protein
LFARSAYRLHASLNPTFPSHTLTVGKLWYADIENALDETTRVVAVPVSYVNRELGRRVVLEFELLWRRSVKGQVLGPYRLFPFRGKPFLDARFAVEPQSMVPATPGEFGNIAFDATHEFLFEFKELMDVAIRKDFVLALKVTDLVTTAALEQPVVGSPLGE